MSDKKMSVREVVALVISAAIVLLSIVYWIAQIRGAAEMIEKAGSF
jgi:hypothetical protein